MKKIRLIFIAFILIAILIAVLIIGFAGRGKEKSENTPVSGADVSPASISNSENQTPAQEPKPVNDFPRYDTIPSSWEKAENAASYEQGFNRRVEEYTQLLAAVGNIIPSLQSRYQSAEEAGRDDSFISLYAAMTQWARIVESYDMEGVPEEYTQRHQYLVELAAVTHEYLGKLPELIVSNNAGEQSRYQDEILKLLNLANN